MAFNNFIPDDDQQEEEIPFLEHLTADDGWQGHSSRRSIEALKADVRQEIGRLQGTVTRFITGEVEIDGHKRPAVQIIYTVIRGDGRVFEGRIDLAGPPFQEPYGGKRSHSGYKASYRNKWDQSLRICLINAHAALKSMRIMQKLSPGYAALIPWMLVDDTGQTISSVWGLGAPALPAPMDENDDGIVEGEYTEAS